MSNRTYLGFVFAFLLTLVPPVVRSGSLHASVPDSAPKSEFDDREVMRFLFAPLAPPARWAIVQGNPPSDGGRRGPGRPRGPARGFNGPVGNRPPREARPPFPPQVIERLRGMKPEDRERFLMRNPRFQKLSAERKAELLSRLNMLLEMNEDQRRELDRRLSVFRNLSPEQRRRARQIYENHWRVLAPARRMAILEEFRHLRDMNADERGQRMASDEYQSQFSSEERALLEELSAL